MSNKPLAMMSAVFILFFDNGNGLVFYALSYQAMEVTTLMSYNLHA